ncbi:glycosyltransferase family 25 protein [Marinobacter sp.]|uniref:glycosyltransferase family 25 protein n=1 Tax=Marinobacter sp. TaxID=50741 RepID=UPI003F9E0ACE
MAPNIVVISLATALERREKISQQLRSLDLEFVFFDAVNGSKGHKLFQHYNSQKRLREEPDDMSPGQLGCYASHYLVWEQCVQSGYPLIVLEDDALLFAERFAAFANEAELLPARLECIRLFAPLREKNKPLRRVFEANGLEVFKYQKGHKSTTGYYLTPAGAEKLLAHGMEWTQPVDLEMDEFWKHGVENYGVLPPCLTNDQGFDSMIGYAGQKPDRKLSVTLYRKVKHLNEALARLTHNLKFRLR